MAKVTVNGRVIDIVTSKGEEYISLTDIAKHKNKNFPADIIKNWMRTRSTIEFLGLWEKINNSKFKQFEFDQFRNESGHNYFVLSPQKWISKTDAKGIISKSGRYGGTFAHKDIAFEFAAWISTEFKLFLIKEFQRLKEEENIRKSLNWDLRRALTKINYEIHKDAIKRNLIPGKVSKDQESRIYASETDVLNVALFGITAKEWKKEGNLRDNANVSQLVCLANLESLNSVLIEERVPQNKRLRKLNEVAISQMKILIEDKRLLEW